MLSKVYSSRDRALGCSLARMHEFMTREIERSKVPSLVTLVSQRGEVYVDAIGTR